MKSAISKVLHVGLLVLPTMALADDIQCGEQYISDGQLEGPFKTEILAACGEPSARDGNTWIYKRPGEDTKLLRFNSNDQLEDIEDQPSD